MRNVVKVNGYIRAVSDHHNPLQTKLSLILTDFAPNGNHQGIPQKEKENIIRTAMHAPIKINFNGTSYAGHTGAFPIGPIVSAYEGQDNGRDVILGEAILWNDIYEDIDEYLKAAFAEGLGTSWEIYYSNAEVDNDGVEWLNDCVFAGTCFVETPAYGPNRTRVLAIAEKIKEVNSQMPEAQADEKLNEGTAEDLTETRNDLNDAQDLLFKLWEGLDSLYTRTFEIEQATVETDLGKIAASFAERIQKIADHIASLSDKIGLSAAELETVTAERDQLKTEKAEAEEATRRAAVTAERKTKLSEVGIEIAEEETEKLERYLSMSEEIFAALIADFAGAKKVSTAERKDSVIPEPISTVKSYTNEEIAEELRKELGSRRR